MHGFQALTWISISVVCLLVFNAHPQWQEAHSWFLQTRKLTPQPSLTRPVLDGIEQYFPALWRSTVPSEIARVVIVTLAYKWNWKCIPYGLNKSTFAHSLYWTVLYLFLAPVYDLSNSKMGTDLKKILIVKEVWS